MVAHPPPKRLCWGPVPPGFSVPLLLQPLLLTVPHDPRLSPPAKAFTERRGGHVFPVFYPFLFVCLFSASPNRQKLDLKNS